MGGGPPRSNGLTVGVGPPVTLHGDAEVEVAVPGGELVPQGVPLGSAPVHRVPLHVLRKEGGGRSRPSFGPQYPRSNLNIRGISR